jgi:hypothetical protein
MADPSTWTLKKMMLTKYWVQALQNLQGVTEYQPQLENLISINSLHKLKTSAKAAEGFLCLELKNVLESKFSRFMHFKRYLT